MKMAKEKEVKELKKELSY